MNQLMLKQSQNTWQISKRNYIGIEIHPEYIEYAKQRLAEMPSYTLELFI